MKELFHALHLLISTLKKLFLLKQIHLEINVIQGKEKNIFKSQDNLQIVKVISLFLKFSCTKKITFIHLLSEHLLITYHMVGTVLGAGDKMTNIVLS